MSSILIFFLPLFLIVTLVVSSFMLERAEKKSVQSREDARFASPDYRRQEIWRTERSLMADWEQRLLMELPKELPLPLKEVINPTVPLMGQSDRDETEQGKRWTNLNNERKMLMRA